MGLTVALGNALSGLRTTETGLDTVSRNVANAGVEGYARRTVASVETFPSGVREGAVKRTLDTVVQRQLRRESAGGAYTATMAQYLNRLDSSFGVPGDASSLDSLYTAFAGKMQALSAEPGNVVAQREVIASARQMAGSLNQLSRDVQGLRSDAEVALASATDEANAALAAIARIESDLTMAGDGNARADLLDERDRNVDRLSRLLDVRVMPRGEDGISIHTANGVALFDGTAARLKFSPKGTIGAGSMYDADPAVSGVGQLTIYNAQGNGIDLSGGGLRSGEMAALLTLRDDTLVTAQARLDAMAAGLARAMSDRPVTGSAVSSGAASGFDLDLAGMQPGNAIRLTVSDASGARSLSLVRVDSAADLPLAETASSGGQIVGIDFSGGMASVAAQIQGILGGGFAVSSPAGSTLRVLDDGAAGTSNVTALSAAVTVTGTASGTAELPLFVDAGNGQAVQLFTDARAGTDQRVGFAARIVINPGIAARPADLVAYGAGVLAGDPTRPQLLAERLTEVDMDFSVPGAGGGAFTGTLDAFVRNQLDVQAGEVGEANNLDAGQQVVVNSLQDRFAELAGVSVDQELAHLVELQNAYAANARIISTVRDMFDVLMNI